MIHRAVIAVVALVSTRAFAGAQPSPAIRSLGPITRASTEPLAAVTAALPMPGGRVLVHDILAQRVLLFDSSLTKAVVVADSTSATGNAYGARPGVLIAYHKDSALFIDPASLSMLVIGPDGKIARVMAIPNATTRPFNIGTLLYTAGIDARDRIVYFAATTTLFQRPTPGKRTSATQILDSGFIVRVDLVTRGLDTVTSIKTPKSHSTIVFAEDGQIGSFENVPDILPVVDDWAACAGGSIAVVRGRDYHVDWLNADGRWRATSKIPFDWQHLDDARKTALIDSALPVIAARRDSTAAAIRARAAAAPPAAGNGARSPRTAGPVPVGASALASVDARPGLNDVPDYWPAFARGAVRADADCNLWIRTTTMLKGQPVYHVVNRRGELVDRVQLPPFRSLAGFGPGVVYMGVIDSAGVAHLERARVK